MQEQEDVLGPSGELSWEALNNMNLLYNCIKEALRMWPPLIFLMRKAKKDIVSPHFSRCCLRRRRRTLAASDGPFVAMYCGLVMFDCVVRLVCGCCV